MRRRFPIGQPRHGTHQPFAVMTHAIRLRIEYHQQSVTLTHGSGHAVLPGVCHPCPSPPACLSPPPHHGSYSGPASCLARLRTPHHPHVRRDSLSYAPARRAPCNAPYGCAPAEQGYKCVFLCNRQDKIKYLFLGILHHLLAGEIRISLSRTGIQQTKVIINLCRCTHRGTWILIRGFLLDGDNRTQSRYLIHVRTFQISQEVTGIG